MHRTSPQPHTGRLLSTAASRPSGGSACLTIVPAGEIHLWVALEAPAPRRSRPCSAVHQGTSRAGRASLPGMVFNGSGRAPGFRGLSQQHGRARALGKEERGARGRERGEETELGVVNRFAFYGVREFISGHSPDGCNKLVKCDPPPGAGALAGCEREGGLVFPGIPQTYPSFLTLSRLPPQRQGRAGHGDQPLSPLGGLVTVGASLCPGPCMGLMGLQGTASSPAAKSGSSGACFGTWAFGYCLPRGLAAGSAGPSCSHLFSAGMGVPLGAEAAFRQCWTL